MHCNRAVTGPAQVPAPPANPAEPAPHMGDGPAAARPHMGTRQLRRPQRRLSARACAPHDPPLASLQHEPPGMATNWPQRPLCPGYREHRNRRLRLHYGDARDPKSICDTLERILLLPAVFDPAARLTSRIKPEGSGPAARLTNRRYTNVAKLLSPQLHAR